MKKLILILATLALIFTSCQTTPKENTKKQKTKINFVLDWLPNTNHTGIYSAIEKGYFADENLEVEVIQPSEDTAETLVASGQGQFGVSFQETVTTARTSDNPVPIVAVAAIVQHNTSGFASLTAKNIRSPKDFEGKTYGSWGTNIEKAFIETVMKKDGADIKKLKIIDTSSYDFLTSVKTHADFQWIYYGWDGISAKVLNQDINFIKLQDIAPELDFYTPVIITSEKLIKEKPKLVKSFLKAATKGYIYAIDNPDKAVNDLLKHAPETDKKIALASQKYLAKEYISDAPRFGEMKEKVWATFSQWMYDNKVINKKLDIKKAYTNEYLPEGNKK